MGFRQLRRLMSEECEECYKNCTECYKDCYDICLPDSPLIPPSTPLPASTSHPNLTTTKLLIVTFTILAAALLVACYYIYYVRFSRGRANARRRRSSSQPEETTTETRDEFLDEDHGPIIDHPIWYINTVGLQPSVINSIAVCKYKKGEGLVEGTDCAVCLSEFEEDETLRLLPKCSHAFHIPCIDTWLRSHTNCPMCRAPIVSNAANIQPSSSDHQVNSSEDDSGVIEETQVVIIEDHDEEQQQQQQQGDLEMGDIGASESRVKAGEGESSGIQAMRRSVSLDSLAASQISQAVREGTSGEGKGKESSSSLRIVPRRGGGNHQGLIRLMCQSSLGRSLQSSSRPIFMKRSFSCNGKFSLPICNNKQSRNKNPPLRSF